MAYFAKLDNNNIVTEVISVSNDYCGEPTLDFPDTEAAGRAFIANTLRLDGLWKQCSFNNNFRKQYAGIGYIYDETSDQFVAPQPYESWTLDSNNDWQAPTAKPEGDYRWDEETLAWVETPAG
jgi:hypothetical protein